MLQARSRLLRQGRARAEPPARVFEGGAGAYRHARALAAKPQGNARPRGGAVAETRTALPHTAPLRRRHKFHRRAVLRLRGVLRGAETLARGKLRVELRHLPGQQAALPLPPQRRQEDRALPHA